MSEPSSLSPLGTAPGAPGARSFRALNPSTGEVLAPLYYSAAGDEIDRTCRLAEVAFEIYGRALPATRADLLRSIADGLEGAGATIVEQACAETALPLPRLHGELGRACFQLRLFAEVLEEGSWVDARIDTGDPERKPAPKPDVRSMRRPLGPVAVFGASNFPLAFSAAGGDTAAALAAGNPVVVKVHPAHPGTTELVGSVIAAAVRHASLPLGTFALLFDDGIAVGEALVRHPAIRAAGFTGSRGGGQALMRLAASRPHPIPVYAEMGSVNPVLILPGALRERGAAIAEGLHRSFTLSVGQFCTNPGVIFIEVGTAGDAFGEALAERTRTTPAGAMLTTRICAAYGEGQARLADAGATLVARGEPGAFAASGQAALWQVDASRVLQEPRLLEEVFGPSTLLVRYRDRQELDRLIRTLDGQLTASVHALPEELSEYATVLHDLEQKVGRLVANQFPTGVEVNHAMVHGGPFPATSDGQSTSVGTHAIERFSRYVAYQNWPDASLPEELRDANPRAIWRLINGKRTREPLPGST
jgi:alpha-ketoglutaric semialdehyde dehydrogenase